MKTLRRALRGMLLMEVLVGVAIFAIGVIMLGNCIAECMRAEMLRMEERDIRNALEATMSEVLSSQVLPENNKEIEVEDSDPAITIFQTRKPLPFKDEQNVPLRGLFEITLTAKWDSRGEPQEQSIRFYLSREE